MRSRRARWAVALVAALTALVVIAGYPLYVSPRTDPVPSPDSPADAVVALGGMPEAGATALQLFEQGRARWLVLSNPYGRDKNVVTRLCKAVAAGRSETAGVTCFIPDPSTTRGEAREIARLAQTNGWQHVVVVAPTFHISRARMIVRRCYAGELSMVEARGRIPIYTWVYEYGYQTAGYLKAFTQDGC